VFFYSSPLSTGSWRSSHFGDLTLLALVLRDGPRSGFWFRWDDAFSAFTLNGSPERYDNAWATVVGIAGAIGGLTLLGAGLGKLIGEQPHRLS